jgi:beta-aspartyl-peptidase (threonine type)
MGGDGGMIGVDAEGNVVMPFNTDGMYRGFIKSSGETETSIYA